MLKSEGVVTRVRAESAPADGRVKSIARFCSAVLVVAGVLTGCEGTVSDPKDVTAQQSAALVWDDGRASVEVNAEISDPSCDGEQGVVSVAGEFIATEALTIVALASIDAGTPVEVQAVGSGDWAVIGRDFIAGFDVDFDVPDGMHRLDICFAIMTPSGPSAVRGCLDPVDIDVGCAGDPPPMDMTPPTIVGSASPAANGNGWNNSDVTVSFSCADEMGGSGLASCSGDVTLTGEAAGQMAVGSATDNAGNSASTSVNDINIDKTAPSITASRSAAPNAAGWNNTPVTVSFACSDALSGIASCSSDATFDSDGMGFSATGTAVDNADNSAMASEGPINIDMTPPVVTLTGGGTYTIDQTVNVTCSASDALSGIASESCATAGGPAWSFGGGTQTVSASATDNAGNVGTASVEINVVVTTQSLCTLTKQFGSSNAIELAACALLNSAGQDIARGHMFSARLKLWAYQLLIATIGRSAFSAEEIAILRSLASSLM